MINDVIRTYVRKSIAGERIDYYRFIEAIMNFMDENSENLSVVEKREITALFFRGQTILDFDADMQGLPIKFTAEAILKYG
jgi:hypothetical protein